MFIGDVSNLVKAYILIAGPVLACHSQRVISQQMYS